MEYLAPAISRPQEVVLQCFSLRTYTYSRKPRTGNRMPCAFNLVSLVGMITSVGTSTTGTRGHC